MQVLQARSKFGLASYRERKGDPLKAVIEGNLKPRKGVPLWLVMSGSARGLVWPEVDKVLGPGQWWPGRLGDEDTRMPMVPGPKWSGALVGGICTGVATGASVTG